MALLFISDLHLSAERPEKIALFERFIDAVAGRCDGLYILGDLFEIWLGDDDDSDPHPRVIEALQRLTVAGTPLAVSRGNRDFLLDMHFAHRTGAVLLPDYHFDFFYGVATVLTHGDLLCTKDVKYQEFRRQVRHPQTQREFLAKSLDERRALAAGMRAGTLASMLEKDDDIMDVDPEAVDQLMLEQRAVRLIHGHTHRPGIHEVDAEDLFYERVVLGDWYGEGRLAVVDQSGARLIEIDRFLKSDWPA